MAPQRTSAPWRVKVDQVRRRLEELGDQTWALAEARLKARPPVATFDGDVRFAVVTVNFSTTRFLKLMLLTLAEQTGLRQLKRVVVVDNASQDGGLPFMRRLAARVPLVELVENRFLLSHARGMRLGFKRLDALDRDRPEAERANVLLSCDTDVIFRRRDTLEVLAKCFDAADVAAAGELRTGLYPYAEAQASFLAVRRDISARRDIAPWVNHGAPAYWLQRSLWRRGFRIAHFASNRGGYILHRGRAGVAAANEHRPHSSYASVADRDPHYMGIEGGAAVWAETEARWAHLLDDRATDELISHLGERLRETPR